MKFPIYVAVLSAVFIIPSKCQNIEAPTKEDIRKTITNLRENVTDALSKVDEAKTLTGPLLSNLKQFAPVEEIENFINVILNDIKQEIDTKLNKVCDDFTDFIINHIDGSENIILPLKKCARKLEKNVDITLPIKKYSTCITGPLENIKQLVIKVITEINNIEKLMNKIINDGQSCLEKFNSLAGFATGSVCLVSLIGHTVAEASKIALSVPGALSEATEFVVNSKLQIDECIVKQTSTIVDTYKAVGIDAAVCSAEVFG